MSLRPRLDRPNKSPVFISQLILISILLLSTDVLFAHGSERGLVLLLPTGFYMVGGAVAVVVSFLLLAKLPVGWLRDRSIGINTSIALPSDRLTSWAGLVFFVVLISAGLFGSRDPLSNPLPLTVWTLWWVGFTVLQAVVGNLWRWLNPWYGISNWLCRLFRRPKAMSLTKTTGYSIAVIQFALFVWFELIFLAPEDPYLLALALIAYWLLNLLGCLVFGKNDWLKYAEPFSIFSRLLGALSSLRFIEERKRLSRVELHWPGYRLSTLPGIDMAGVLFILLTLSSVSFDGFARTFTWLSVLNINPLEFPGRSAVSTGNSIGLLFTFALLSILYFSCVWIGCRLANRPELVNQSLGCLVYSLIPISLVFHFAHYFTQFMVNGQYALIAWSDPFNTGVDMFGVAGNHVTTSFLASLDSVRLIWTIQTTAIVFGHIAGILVAHKIALRIHSDQRSAVMSQLPLAILMVGYTVFGLWLLSTPSIG
ncbi:MAG: hypothetical protein ACI8P9_001231 [Parasphingorhabdus sp.]